jgi:tetratricopeptide (TPR) repeat protein
VTTYSLQNVARIVKVAPSRLRYWRRTRLTPPRRPETAGPEDYDFRDLVGIKAVLSLLEQGISLQRVRRSLEVLRERIPELEDPLVALRLLAEGSQHVVLEHDGRLMEPDGQMLLGFLSLEPEGGDVAAIDRGQDLEAPPEAEESAGKYFERGCTLDSDDGTYELAAEAYRAAIRLDPDFADAHCNLGAVFYNRGQREEARRHFERCLRLEPSHIEAHFNLANMLEEDGCNDMALHHYKMGLAADPFYPDLHINLALLLEKMTLAGKARHHWKRYLQLQPEGSWAEVAKLRLDRASD